jgi:hypothetical protein
MAGEPRAMFTDQPRLEAEQLAVLIRKYYSVGKQRVLCSALSGRVRTFVTKCYIHDSITLFSYLVLSLFHVHYTTADRYLSSNGQNKYRPNHPHIPRSQLVLRTIIL